MNEGVIGLNRFINGSVNFTKIFMNKNSHLITRFAFLIIICMGIILLYVWINYDDIKSEQIIRQIWHMNNKF